MHSGNTQYLYMWLNQWLSPWDLLSWWAGCDVGRLFPHQNREFTGLPLHGLLCWEWEATLWTTREWRALESIFVVNCGVCLFVREGQSGFEYVLNYVLCIWICGFGEGIWCVCSLFLFFLLCSDFNVFFSLKKEISKVPHKNTPFERLHFLILIYTPPTFVLQESGSRPRNGWCCFLHSLSQTLLFSFFFYYTSCFSCHCRSALCGLGIFCYNWLCGANILYCILSCFPIKIYSTFSHRCKHWTNLTGSIFHPNFLVLETFPELYRGSLPWALSLLHSVPAKRLSGTSYYCSHHLLHPTGPPSWRPAPTSLLLLHLSKETKIEKDMSYRHDQNREGKWDMER